MRLLRKAALAAAVGVVSLVAASAAAADPTGSKNSFTFPATCNGMAVTLTVNSANGQGQGTQNNNMQASFAPAHVAGSNLVFHPTQFNLLFTFGFDGQTFSFLDTAAMHNAKTPVTCSIDYTATESDGTLSLLGTASGFFS
jgi:hypothetical protein